MTQDLHDGAATPDEGRSRRGVTAAAGTALAVGLGAVARRAVATRAARLTAPPGVHARDVDLGPVISHHVVTPDGARIAVRELGDRRHPTLLLVHGLTNQWWIWAHVIAALRHDHHVVVPDLRGHGASTLGEDGMDLAAVGRDLATVMTKLDLTHATVAGYSMGGMATLRFLVEHPDVVATRVARVVLLATSAAVSSLGVRDGGAIRTSSWVAPSYQLQAALPALKPAYGRAPLWTVLLGAAAYTRDASGPAVEDLLAMHAESTSAVTAGAMRAMARQDLRDRLGEIRVPTLVAVGSNDVTIGPAHSEVLAALIPSASMEEISGARHGLLLERPRDVARLLRRPDR